MMLGRSEYENKELVVPTKTTPEISECGKPQVCSDILDKLRLFVVKKDSKYLDMALIYLLDLSGQSRYEDEYRNIFEYNLRKLIFHNMKIKYGMKTEEMKQMSTFLDEFESDLKLDICDEAVDMLIEICSTFWKDDIKERISSMSQEEKYILNFALNYIKYIVDTGDCIFRGKFYFKSIGESERIYNEWTTRCEKYYGIKLKEDGKIKLRTYNGEVNNTILVTSNIFTSWQLIDILIKAGIGHYVGDMTTYGKSNIYLAILKNSFEYVLTNNFVDIKNVDKIRPIPHFSWDSIFIEDDPDIMNKDVHNDEKILKARAENHNTVDIKVDILAVMKDINIAELYIVPDCIGTYIFTIESGEIYIGHSVNVLKRLSQHNAKYNIRSVNVYQTRTVMDATILEYYLIKKFCPSLNKEKENLTKEEIVQIK